MSEVEKSYPLLPVNSTVAQDHLVSSGMKRYESIRDSLVIWFVPGLWFFKNMENIMTKKSYIIRVYEQPLVNGNNTKMFNGIVEDVDTGIKHAFHNRNELWQFMTEYKEQAIDQPVKK